MKMLAGQKVLKNTDLKEAIRKAVLARAEMRTLRGYEITKHVLDSIKQEVHLILKHGNGQRIMI